MLAPTTLGCTLAARILRRFYVRRPPIQHSLLTVTVLERKQAEAAAALQRPDSQRRVDDQPPV